MNAEYIPIEELGNLRDVDGLVLKFQTSQGLVDDELVQDVNQIQLRAAGIDRLILVLVEKLNVLLIEIRVLGMVIASLGCRFQWFKELVSADVAVQIELSHQHGLGDCIHGQRRSFTPGHRSFLH